MFQIRTHLPAIVAVFFAAVSTPAVAELEAGTWQGSVTMTMTSNQAAAVKAQLTPGAGKMTVGAPMDCELRLSARAASGGTTTYTAAASSLACERVNEVQITDKGQLTLKSGSKQFATGMLVKSLF